MFKKARIINTGVPIDAIGVIFSGIVLLWMILGERPADFLAHIDMSRSLPVSEWFSYSILYPALHLVIVLANSLLIERLALAFILFAAIVGRWGVTRQAFRDSGLSSRQRSVVCLGLLTFMPLVNPRLFAQGVGPLELEFYSDMYLGQFTPNVWHNSTTILLGPFALLAAHNINRFSDYPTRRQLFLGGLFLLLSALAKPNYVFAAVPAMVILGYWLFNSPGSSPRMRVSRTLFVITPALLLVSLQFLNTFIRPSSDFAGSISLQPLVQWRAFSNDLAMSTARSLVLPAAIFVFLLFFRQRISKSLIFAWLTFGVAFSTFALFVETWPDGSPRLQGNLSWGLIPATYVLLVYSLFEWFRYKSNAQPTLRIRTANALIWTLFVAHALGGAIYCTLIALGKMSYA